MSKKMNTSKEFIGSVVEKRFFFFGVIIIGLIFPIIIKTEVSNYYISAVMSIFYAALHWSMVRYILYRHWKKYNKYNDITKRLILDFFTVLFTVFFVNIIIGYVIDSIIFRHNFSIYTSLRIVILATIFCFTITTIYEAMNIIEQWRYALVETEKLKNATIQAEFSALKNQLSPHFLFNSLNTLMSIIPEDTNLALKFTQELSDVYRYILENREKDLVNLHTELEFAKKYVFLQKIRFGESLCVDFCIDESHFYDEIPPLTLQMLLENAIKHNIISTAKPLKIEIYSENDQYILIKNNLQKKRQISESTQVGLANIHKRYAYLISIPVDVIITPHTFTVALPLLKHHSPRAGDDSVRVAMKL